MAEETQKQVRKRQMVEGYEVVAETLTVEEERQTVETAAMKRRKSYNHIISLLADEDDQKFDPDTKSTSDLSFFMTALQQELSDSNAAPSATAPDAASPMSDDEEKERVFRHLLEASDDELGLPTKTEESVISGENSSFSDESLIMEGFDDLGEANLWEIEDESANYYDMLQSDLFM